MTPKPLLIYALGEVLVDIFPEGKKIGGAPFNFVFHLHRLGLPTTFLTRVGSDKQGHYILDFLKAQGMDVSWTQLDTLRPTGTVTIHMNPDGSHRFTSSNHSAHDYLCVPSDLNSGRGTPKLVFFGTYGLRHADARQTHWKILEQMKGRSILFCDINIRPPYMSRETVERALEFCDVLKISEEDLQLVRTLIPDLPGDMRAAVELLAERYHIPKCFLTSGEHGSAFFDGMQWLSTAAVPVSVVNSVGAGDAFSAIIAGGLVLDWDSSKILSCASLFAAAVCGEMGAIPEKKTFYDPFKAWF